MEKQEQQIYAFQIDLDQYFDHLKRTINRGKNISSPIAKVALETLKRETNEDARSLSKRAFSFSNLSTLNR